MKFWHKIIFLALLPLKVFPQAGIKFNAAHISDPRTMFVNPAIISFQPQKWMGIIGYERFFTGLDVNLNNSLFGATFSAEKLGVLGFTGQVFSSPILKKDDFQLLYSYQIWNNRLSVGINLGRIHFGLESANFQLLQPNDPLLMAKNSFSKFNLGAGILFQPIKHLYAGFGVNHLNRPTFSFDKMGPKEPYQLNAGLFYDHQLIKPMISVERSQGMTCFNLGVETWIFKDQAMLRGLYAREALSFGLAYCFKNIRLDYEFAYPLNELNQISNGTHQFLISWFCDNSPKEWGLTPDFEIEVHPDQPQFPAEQGIFPGQKASFWIRILPRNGFSDRVSLTTGELPHFFTADFQDNKISWSDSTRVHFKIGTGCPAGIFQTDIIGESKNLADVKKVRIKVNPLPEICAKIACQPEVMKIIKIQQIHEENPLLNYIFFNENTCQLDPNRYELLNEQAAPQGFVFFADSVSGIQEQYKNMLNLIAGRMQQWPESKINLIGCNADFGLEKGNLQLSQLRARAVKKYLTQNCGIDSQRIQISWRNVPEDSSSSQIEEGRAENRRVEIYVDLDSEKILEPFITTSSQIVTSDSICTILTTGTKAAAGIKSWRIDIQNRAGAMVKQFSKTGTPPDKIIWDWKTDPHESISPDQTFQIGLTITDSLNQIAQSEKAAIRTEYEIIQQETALQKIEKTRLFLFKFDEDRIDVNSPRLQEKLDHLTRRIAEIPNARVLLKGFTDTIGLDDYNLQLSIRRATTIRHELIRRGIAESQIEARGFGRQDPLMDNSLPEGRMMNRRVEVYIEIP